MSTPDPVPAAPTPAPTPAPDPQPVPEPPPPPPTPAQQLQNDLCDRLLAMRRYHTAECTKLSEAATLPADHQAHIAAIDAQLGAWGITPPTS